MRLPLLLLGFMLLLAILAPFAAPYDPMLTNPDEVMQPPGVAHPLGTDNLGRDVFSRVLHGAGRTLLIAFGAASVSVLPGLLLGVIAGMGTKFITAALDVLLNSLLAVPALVLALVVITLAGRGVWPVILATGIAQIAPYARVTRAAVLAGCASPAIEGARAIGAGQWGIIRRYVLPHATPTLLGYAGVIFGYSLLNSAALSFLGLTGQPGVPDWGVILAEGRQVFRTAPWVSIAPGLLITLTVWSVNTLADGMSSGWRR